MEVQILKRFLADSHRQGAASRAFPHQMQLSLQNAAVCHLLPMINSKPVDSRAGELSQEVCVPIPVKCHTASTQVLETLCLELTAGSHHHRVDGHPQLQRFWAPTHQSGLCWARHNHRPGKSQGKATQVGWENKLFKEGMCYGRLFLLLFSFFFKASNKKKNYLGWQY